MDCDEFSFQIRVELVEFYSISYSMVTSDIRYGYCSRPQKSRLILIPYLYYTLCSRILCKRIFCLLCP